MKKGFKIGIGFFTAFCLISITALGFIFISAAEDEAITWSPTDKTSNMLLSNNNLTVDTVSDGSWGGIRASIGKASGKWYYEIIVEAAHDYFGIGIATESFVLDSPYDGRCPYIWQSNSSCGGPGNPWSITDIGPIMTGNIIGVALDLDNKTCTLYRNGQVTSKGTVSITYTGTIYPFIGKYSTSSISQKLTANFGRQAFQYPIPSGYQAYDSAASPTPTLTPVPTDTPAPTNTPVPTDTPTPIPSSTSVPAGDSAILSISLSNGNVKEYDMTAQEISDFKAWYNNRSAGSGPAAYEITCDYNKGPFISRKDYIAFDKIVSFGVSEYNRN